MMSSDHDRSTRHPATDRRPRRARCGEPPMDEVDWESLRRSIAARAEIPLARRRAARPAAGGGRARPRRLVSLAVAAVLAAAVWLGELPGISRGTTGAVSTSAQIDEVLRLDLTEQEFRLLVTGRAEPEALLAIAVDDS